MVNNDSLKEAKTLMGALVRMKPKSHDEMKVGLSRKSLGKVATKSTKAKSKD